jgi:hypothetical protein
MNCLFRKVCVATYAWLALLFLTGPSVHAATVDRASVETAIIFNIFLFTSWPGEELQAPDAAFMLCMDTASRIYSSARQLEGQALRRMRVRVQTVDVASRCHAIYVDSGVSQKAASAAVGPVLVIAGSRYEALETPTIQLFEAEGRLAFDISQRKVSHAGLQISSKLLRLARKVLE